MIGFFPQPYPDELLYSTCARYGRRANYPNRRSTVEQLFGSRSFSAAVDFPNRLEAFLGVFPPHNYTADALINRNTLLPFHEPFISVERAQQIRSEMKFAGENHIRMRLGLNIPQVKSSEYLRFCPLCAEEDIGNYGKTYWHRIHQPAGILVCAGHNCFLQNSMVGSEREKSYNFHCADESINIMPPRFLSNDDPEHELFLYLARNAEWLLNQENLCVEEGTLRERYYNLLLKRGYAYYNGRIRNAPLLEAFDNHFPPRVLETLGCTVMSAQTGWLAKMMEKGRSNIIQHPIRHLLLMHFLGVTAEEFFTSFVEYRPFGSGPYPCLNKASDHYGEPKIPNCEIFDNTVKKKRGQPLGVFACDCGFVYQRVGSDRSEKARFTYSSVKEYGKTWENKLEELWTDLSFPVTEVAGIFGVSDLLIVRHAIRLGLPMNYPGARTVLGYKRRRNPRKTFSELLAKHRRKWLKTVKKHSGSTRQELMDKAGTLYLWLLRHDSDWFERHLPKTEITSGTGRSTDWRSIDDELSKEVEQACRDILESNDPILRVGITEIIKRVGKQSWLEKRDEKLPKTAGVINRYSETLEDFMLRRIRRIEESLIEEGNTVSRSGFIERARLKNSTAKNSLPVQEAINAALRKIGFAATGEDMSLPT